MTLNQVIGERLMWVALCVLALWGTHELLQTPKLWLYDMATHAFVAGVVFRIAHYCGEKIYPRMETKGESNCSE